MSANPSQILKGHEYISLITYRKTGEPVATPVWFVEIGEKLYVRTMPQSGKVKRIQIQPEVKLAPCDQVGKILGSTIQGTARLVKAEEEAPIYQALLQKYGSTLRMIEAENQSSDRVYIEITPHLER